MLFLMQNASEVALETVFLRVYRFPQSCFIPAVKRGIPRNESPLEARQGLRHMIDGNLPPATPKTLWNVDTYTRSSDGLEDRYITPGAMFNGMDERIFALFLKERSSRIPKLGIVIGAVYQCWGIAGALKLIMPSAVRSPSAKALAGSLHAAQLPDRSR